MAVNPLILLVPIRKRMAEVLKGHKSLGALPSQQGTMNYSKQWKSKFTK